MAVQCAHCGEELLGSVNRCWRCGRALQAHAGPTDLPPVRRPPIIGPLFGPLEALLVDLPAAESAAIQRRGSPFTAGSVTTRLPPPENSGPARAMPRPIVSAANVARQMASGLSVVLSLFALLLLSGLPIGALLLALAAVGFAAWGIDSRHRGLAIAALVFNCLVLAPAFVLASLAIYRAM